MVNPGSLSFAIIRGIAFDGAILQCRDEKVLVISPDPTFSGLYVPCGTFSGYDLFILPGTPSLFLYFNPVYASYVIANILSLGTLTNYWLPSPVLIEPTGDYIGHGSLAGTTIATDNPVDLTGLAPEAKVRRTEKTGAEVFLDLQPYVSNALIGEITIPAISKDDTEDLPYVGDFRWDLVLRNTTTEERFGPFAKGQFIVSDNITQPVI